MAAHDKARWHPPLKAPAIEVVDLLSDSDSVDTPQGTTEKGKHDAYSTVLRAKETTDSDVRWRTPLKAPAIAFDDSLSRDVSTGIGDILASGEDSKARDASTEVSDSDDDSQLSLYEDALGEDDDEMALHSSERTPNLSLMPATLTYAGEGSCTLEESLALRKRLRLIGGDRFVGETVDAGIITAKKLCTAFGIRPPFFLEGEPDEAYYSLLDLALCRELSKRAKLSQHNTIEDAVALLKKSRNIIVLTGAGVRMMWQILELGLMGTDINQSRYSRLQIQEYRSLLPTPTSRPR